MAHPGGRPTDYTPELIAKAREYVSSLPEDEKVPSIEGLALYIGITRKTIYEWISQENKQEFCDIVEAILAKQAKSLMNKGLDNTFNSSIVKLLLSKHGYAEKTETDITTKGESVNLDAKTLALAKEYESKLKENL